MVWRLLLEFLCFIIQDSEELENRREKMVMWLAVYLLIV